MECTFFGEASRSRGQRFKHLHLSDLADRVQQFRNRDLVLHHASWRFDETQIRSAVEQELRGLEPRVHLLMD